MESQHQELFKFAYGIHYDHLTILFHAWEFSILFVIMIIVADGNLFVLAVGIGFIQHLIFDQCTNPIKPLAYFITYRLKHKFRKESILSDDFIASLPRD